MKKFFALPLAVVFVAACSDSSTAPSATSDLTPSYAKPGPGPGPTPVVGTTTDLTFDFNGSVIAAGTLGVAAFVTEDQTNAAGTSAASSIGSADYLPGTTNGFLGRFANISDQAVLNVGNGGSRYSISFDLYIIGTWDGKGKQAQHGAFQANVWSIGTRCGAPSQAFDNLFSTTFSNQVTVQQDFPAPAGSGGGAKATTGAYKVNELGYSGRLDLTNIAPFKPIADSWYKLSYTGDNPCGVGQPMSFVFRASNPLAQPTWDESWAIDNVVIKTDS
jgi:hypothetical protein